MNINFDNLDQLVIKETMKAVRESLGSLMGDDEAEKEKKRQERQAKAVNARGLGKGGSTDESHHEADDEEAEETGVPTGLDSDEAGAERREDRTGGKGTKDSPKLKTPSVTKIKKVTVGGVIDKLNALRGGRSLKDPEVQKSFKQYFEALTTTERQTLLIFLTGIAQVLAGTEAGADAIDPGDVGLRVGGEVPHPEEKTDKKPSGQSTQLTKKPEDTPIVVGEVASARVKRAIAQYKKISRLR